MTRVLVTGARGLLGTAIAREFARDVDVSALGHGELDITDADAVRRTVGRSPDRMVDGRLPAQNAENELVDQSDVPG